MGKSYQGVHGNWSGKTGNVVGRESQGRTIYSIYQKNVHNPRTQAQVLHRKKFTLLTKFGQRIKAFIKETFMNLDGYDLGNFFSAFIGYNFKHEPSVFDTTDPGNPALVYENLQVSCTNGVVLPTGIAAEANDHTVGVTWTDNSGDWGAQADDLAMLLVYNENKGRAVGNSDGTRNSRRAEQTYSNSWEGDTLHAYLVFKNADGDLFSETYYLGDFEG